MAVEQLPTEIRLMSPLWNLQPGVRLDLLSQFRRPCPGDVVAVSADGLTVWLKAVDNPRFGLPSPR